MPRGDTENAFQRAAADDGIALVRARVPWLNQRGHLGLPDAAASVVPALRSIFLALGGNEPEQAAKRLTALPGDFVHLESMTFIEVDEHQHFTTRRLATLDLYPENAPLAFDLEEYAALCHEWSSRADRYRPGKAAIAFGANRRQAQRAYHDALRDLVVPALGHPPLVRVAAPERDGSLAYARIRDRLAALRS
ncbi:hypothetical protein [Nocardioides sp. zg-DK7169]|uniref:DUF7255 family protein n=1 Tax=Nocardioides sp. zg-DK7169 TaxID=2736600 RepID=UPI0015570D2C|nr:hypothetical protein [Nocardioides sp. zg-DK7169]NPC98798.1 hypothetical protein [Nocardioides sp. zg-DK7169]